MFLQINNLTKKYGEHTVVDNLSFGVEEGRLLCVLGPSGCGKTTVLRAIGGFLDITSGTVVLDNEDITHLDPSKRPVSTVFQSYGLFPHMTVLENIAYGLKFRDLPASKRHSRANEYLELVKLGGHGDKRISELSGGQQQRVALARSLVIEPKVLLLDEPLSNLDAKLRVEMREEISRIQKSINMTTIFVTHDQEEAFSIGDEILILESGVLQQVGTPSEIYDAPVNDFVWNFIGRANRLSDTKGYIRPERIRPNPNSAHKVKIEKVEILGSTVLYYFKYENKEMTMLRLNEEKRFEVGDVIGIDFDEV